MSDIEKIEKAEVGQEIELEHRLYRTLEFKFQRGHGYYWIIHARRHQHLIFPMLTSSTVKYFKTLNGAKRNAKRYLGED